MKPARRVNEHEIFRDFVKTEGVPHPDALPSMGDITEPKPCNEWMQVIGNLGAQRQRPVQHSPTAVEPMPTKQQRDAQRALRGKPSVAEGKPQRPSYPVKLTAEEQAAKSFRWRVGRREAIATNENLGPQATKLAQRARQQLRRDTNEQEAPLSPREAKRRARLDEYRQRYAAEQENPLKTPEADGARRSKYTFVDSNSGVSRRGGR